MDKLMQQKLERYFESHQKVRVTSDIDDDIEIYHGYIVGLSSKLVCIATFNEFRFDGFIILPITYISQVRHGKFEKAYHRVLKLENELDKVVTPNWLKLGSLKSAIKSISKYSDAVSFESRLPDTNIFFIGEIKEIGEKQVMVKTFNAEGKWNKDYNSIEYSDITAIKFDDHYATVFRRHIKD